MTVDLMVAPAATHPSAPTHPPHGSGPTPVQLLRQELLTDPGRPAVCEPATGCILTVADLWAGATRVAAGLRTLGVRPQDRVGLFMEPGVDLVVAAWGVLLAGAGYVPLPVSLPTARVELMAGDASVRVLVVDAALAGRAEEVAPRAVLSTVRDLAARSGTDTPRQPGPNTPPPDALAYVVYTSGSTGRPKGVMVEHGGLGHQLAWLRGSGLLRPRARLLFKTPIGFDAAQWELLASACGATVVVAESGTNRDPERLLRLVREQQITAVQCVPTLWTALAAHPELADCTSLSDLYSGGEVLATALARRLLAALPTARLVNLYGPTETTINATAQVLTADSAAALDTPTVPIGNPVDGHELTVLDDDLAPVAPGEVGELVITGPQVARGYVADPQQTAARFLTRANAQGRQVRAYRTGDRVRWDERAGLCFVGRDDTQVKINGHRIELDEVRNAVEEHRWIRQAVVVPHEDPSTGCTGLVAFVGLDSEEAALMDQGEGGGHHSSKGSRVQVRAQLAQLGRRRDLTGPGLPLPGAEPSLEQVREVFARKTYRIFEGSGVDADTIREWLARAGQPPENPCVTDDPVPEAGRLPDLDGVGRLLRWLGPFESPDRLLPKFAYASPGALVATQLYLRCAGIAGLPDGLYYFDQYAHRLDRVDVEASTPLFGDLAAPADCPAGEPLLEVHLVGIRTAITSVYVTNVDEVLHLEAGHLLGALDRALAGLGLSTTEIPALAANLLGLGDEAVALAAVRVHPGPARTLPAEVGILLQGHARRVPGLAPGLTRAGARWQHLGPDTIRRRDVIAINQASYDDAAFGVLLTTSTGHGWRGLVQLGRAMHHLQAAGGGIGLMSAGYSSLTGRPLPSAARYRELTGHDELTYFALAGPVTQAQIAARDMAQDRVHSRGPAEILRDELARTLPRYMVPRQIHVLDEIPTTATGKTDLVALRRIADDTARNRESVPPATPSEAQVLSIWQELVPHSASVVDDFFAIGGDSLTSVQLIHRLNDRLGARLPLQAIFEHSTPRALAGLLDGAAASTGGPTHPEEAAHGDRRGSTDPAGTASVPIGRAGNSEPADEKPNRLVRLASPGKGLPPGKGARPGDALFCWPGLGGFPMNLTPLAHGLASDRDVLGIQASGINPGEPVLDGITSMASADVELIRRRQPDGPYSLLGYSFGARVAFEAAYQLEQAGAQVSALVLVAPGSPLLGAPKAPSTQGPWAGAPSGKADYRSPDFLTILLSVFLAELPASQVLRDCRAAVHDAESFADFLDRHLPGLDQELILRVTRLVEHTYESTYTFHELTGRTVRAPITVVKAQGDDYSFLEGSQRFSVCDPTTVQMPSDHYSVLRPPEVARLITAVGAALESGHDHHPSTRPVPSTRPGPSTRPVPSTSPGRRPAPSRPHHRGFTHHESEPAQPQLLSTPHPRGDVMPHVSVKHFPVQLDPELRARLAHDMTRLVSSALGCAPGAVSIALEEVPESDWRAKVYLPEIAGKRDLLCKEPEYRM
ncbi:MAG: amino acid adenylation domain-containing protein [Actinomycetales bacterium]